MTGKFENLTLSGYKITYNPAELDSENGITPEISIKNLKDLINYTTY